jgi:predicted porin
VTPSLFFSTLENFSMKKTLIALAAVAVSSAAMAQVTVSGVINARYQSSDTTGNGVVKGMTFSDSEIVFSASEDLGGGLKASGSMSIEGLSDGANGTGSGVILGLSGGFGSVTFSNKDGSDYLAVNEVTAGGFTNSFADDRITYTSPNISGLTLSVTLGDGVRGATAVGESATDKSRTVELNYAAGPLTANVGMLSVDKNTHTSLDGGTRFKVGYNFGVAAVTYGQANVTNSPTSKTTETATTISVPLGAITASLAMATSKTGTDAQLNGSNLTVAYALSKRTSLSFNRIDYETSSLSNLHKNQFNVTHSF